MTASGASRSTSPSKDAKASMPGPSHGGGHDFGAEYAWYSVKPRISVSTTAKASRQWPMVLRFFLSMRFFKSNV